MINRISDNVVEFAFYRPGAQSVRLVGDFNRWSTDMHRLQRDDKGWWRLRLEVTPGEYRFKYLVDDDMWEADFASYGVEPDRFGGWNSILWIDAAGLQKRKAA
jgi:1,4-alpha-glucan branching enzyme